MNKAELQKRNDYLEARVETLMSEAADLGLATHYDYLVLVSELAFQSMLLTAGCNFKAFENIFNTCMDGMSTGELEESE